MISRFSLVAAAVLSFSASVAYAQELRPIQGQTIHLGAVSGIVYFQPQGEDDRLVATLSVGEELTPVRFEASLRPGQSALVSVPRGPGQSAIEVQFERRGNSVFVGDGAAVTQ